MMVIDAVTKSVNVERGVYMGKKLLAVLPFIALAMYGIYLLFSEGLL